MLFRKNVDSVLSFISKAVEDLEVICEHQEGVAIGHEMEAAKRTHFAKLARAESERANRVRNRIKDLLA